MTPVIRDNRGRASRRAMTAVFVYALVLIDHSRNSVECEPSIASHNRFAMPREKDGAAMNRKGDDKNRAETGEPIQLDSTLRRRKKPATAEESKAARPSATGRKKGRASSKTRR